MRKTASIPLEALGVDACIIDEQPDHLVITARIPKSLISNNLPLLAALAEQGAPRRSADRSDVFLSAHQFKTKISKSKFAAAATLILALCFSIMTLPITANDQPPLAVYSTILETPVVRQGGDLLVTMVSRRVRVCKTDIDRIILRSDGTTIWRSRMAGIGQAVTDHGIERKIRFKLPDGLPPGKYIYRSTTFSDCGGQSQFSLQLPDLAFELAG